MIESIVNFHCKRPHFRAKYENNPAQIQFKNQTLPLARRGKQLTTTEAYEP